MTITINEFLTNLEPSELKIHLNIIAEKHAQKNSISQLQQLLNSIAIKTNIKRGQYRIFFA
jgi:hypothetical protein